MSLLVDSLLTYHLSKGKPENCPLIIWLKAEGVKIDKLPAGKVFDLAENALRVKLTQRPEWDLSDSLAGIHVTDTYPEPKKSIVQAIYMKHIMDSTDSERSKGMLLSLVASKKRKGILTDSTLISQIKTKLGIA